MLFRPIGVPSLQSMLEASVIVPTRHRPRYLRVALESLAAQDLRSSDYEVLVVDDGPSAETRAVAEQVARRTGARIGYVERQGVPGLNSARNTGIAAADSPFLVFVDDDVEAPKGWLRELVDGRRRHPDHMVFGGPIRVRLEGSRLRMCGREAPPITTLDHGLRDREIELVWGANMAIDRRAFDLAGVFDPGVPYGFDEDMWERRLRDAGGRIMYVARAGLVHRRDREGRPNRAARPRRLQARTQSARLQRLRRPRTRPRRRAACARRLRVPHIPLPLRQRHPAHGPLCRPRARVCHRACMSGTPQSASVPGDFDLERLVSGESGTVAGPRARARARLQDLLDDAALWSRFVPPRLDRAAKRSAHGRVHVLGLYSADLGANMATVVTEISGSRRHVDFALGALDDANDTIRQQTVESGLGGGKFENLNALLEAAPPADADWVVVVDDDVELPRGFLDQLLFVAEQFGFQLVQPALRRTSHAAWHVCRRERWSIARRAAPRRDRPAARHPPFDRERPAPISSVANGMGTGPPLGRTRARAGLAARDRRRGSGSSRAARRRGHVRSPSGARRDAPFPGRRPASHRSRGCPPCARALPRLALIHAISAIVSGVPTVRRTSATLGDRLLLDIGGPAPSVHAVGWDQGSLF